MTGAGQGREGKKRGVFSPETRGESREEEEEGGVDHMAGFWGSRRLFVEEEVAGKKRSVPFL
jgi:hypothetical protein